MSSPASTIALLDATVELAAGSYPRGEPGAERVATLAGVRIGRWPVVNASVARFVHATRPDVSPGLARKLADSLLADHPATHLTYQEAAAFCAWAGGRLPTGDEWEAAARREDGRAWPWGETFDPDCCACVESGWGWTGARFAAAAISTTPGACVPRASWPPTRRGPRRPPAFGSSSNQGGTRDPGFRDDHRRAA
jgi:formylglycine-generating enzyme required for sulfatase activity